MDPYRDSECAEPVDEDAEGEDPTCTCPTGLRNWTMCPGDLARPIKAWYVADRSDGHKHRMPYEKEPAKKVAAAGKQVVRKGNALRGKAVGTTRQLKKTVADAVSASSRRLKKGIKKTKSCWVFLQQLCFVLFTISFVS